MKKWNFRHNECSNFHEDCRADCSSSIGNKEEGGPRHLDKAGPGCLILPNQRFLETGLEFWDSEATLRHVWPSWRHLKSLHVSWENKQQQTGWCLSADPVVKCRVVISFLIHKTIFLIIYVKSFVKQITRHVEKRFRQTGGKRLVLPRSLKFAIEKFTLVRLNHKWLNTVKRWMAWYA